ncbi:MAG: hypothetical protein C5B50_23480 [Verrucomicrobia bacterium]|nr:MAG: hypothetical protein C5B50_23480 [Verrucomicrobiota bacterium]
MKLAIVFVLLSATLARGSTGAIASRQRSLDEWRSLTSSNAPPPRVFVKGDAVHLYFKQDTNLAAFKAGWGWHRTPTRGYKVTSALLRWESSGKPISAPPMVSRSTDEARGRWREATIIAGADWRLLSTNLVAALTPATPGHGIYYQGFFGDRFWFRDNQGVPHFSSMTEPHKDIIIDRRFSVDETLELVARLISEHLSGTHSNQSLFLLMPANTSRLTQPLLLDQHGRHCVQLLPAALYDTTDQASTLTGTAQGVQVMLLEAHGLALIKNPVSSAARLADLGIQTIVRILRFPLPHGARTASSARSSSGSATAVAKPARPHMDLDAWESWLDKYTGTRREEGSLELFLDGEHFFPRLHQAIAEATNHISMDVYIFDRDDVAVEIADRLKERSKQVEVKVILDRMGSLAAGLVPPATPLPEDFAGPASISSYLKTDSQVHVHPFYNPWFSADHSKVFLVDGNRAWLGGMNIGREYRYEWHDLMVEVHGSVVASLENDFRRDWAHASVLGDLAYVYALLTTNPETTDCEPQPTDHRPLTKDQDPTQGAAAAQQANLAHDFLTGNTPDIQHPVSSIQYPASPTTSTIHHPSSTIHPPSTVRLLPTRTLWKPFASAVLGSISKAQDYIYVENSYLFDKTVVRRLVQARARGVDVRVILPRFNDLKAGGRGNLVKANYLIQNGVRVYFYPGMSHVKALLVDDWACVGSGNLNHLSLRLCQEHNIATSDPEFTSHLKRELFEEDFAHSYELTAPISVDWMDVLADFVLENF